MILNLLDPDCPNMGGLSPLFLLCILDDLVHLKSDVVQFIINCSTESVLVSPSNFSLLEHKGAANLLQPC